MAHGVYGSALPFHTKAQFVGSSVPDHSAASPATAARAWRRTALGCTSLDRGFFVDRWEERGGGRHGGSASCGFRWWKRRSKNMDAP